jgi:hypothetical protein
MVRRALALALSLPLMIAGGVAAHALAYQLAVPNAAARATLLAATGHAYIAWLPGLIGILSALAVVLLAALVFGRGSTLERVRLRPEIFVLLPMVTFAVQEFTERAFSGYVSPWHVWQEPTFWRGLLLQIPFGVAAFLIASFLLGTARILHRVVERRRHAGAAPAVVTLRTRTLTPLSRVLPARVRCGDALRFRGPPATARPCL